MRPPCPPSPTPGRHHGTCATAELTFLPLADDREKTGEGTLVDGNLLRAGLWGMGVPLMAKLGHPGMMAAGTKPTLDRFA